MFDSFFLLALVFTVLLKLSNWTLSHLFAANYRKIHYFASFYTQLLIPTGREREKKSYTFLHKYKPCFGLLQLSWSFSKREQAFEKQFQFWVFFLLLNIVCFMILSQYVHRAVTFTVVITISVSWICYLFLI